MTSDKLDIAWINEQVAKYAEVYPRYSNYAKTLYKILRAAMVRISPTAIVQAREKSIPSFTEKIIRKKYNQPDPVRSFTDLCGARVIVQTRDEIEKACDFIKTNFWIDWDNSVDVSERLKFNEFGYRSVHYVVQLNPGNIKELGFGIEIPDSLLPDEKTPMKAEIQVRTSLENTWSEFEHEKSYKSAFPIPDIWSRELAVVAALLENADSILTRVAGGLKKYESNFGSYMSIHELRREIEVQKIILKYTPDDHLVAHKLGKLYMALGEWQNAVDTLTKYQDQDYQPIIRDLGISVIKLNSKNKASDEYKAGQDILLKAIDMKQDDTDAIASLAGSYKGLDDKRVLKLYKRAFEMDPGDPYVLGNYLETEIRERVDATVVSMMAQSMQSAIERCNEQVAVGVNYPWAFFDLGKFSLLLGRPYMSLHAYMRAVQLSTASFMISTSLKSLEYLGPALKDTPGYDWAVNLLKLGRAARFMDESSIRELTDLASKNHKKIEGPVVIVVGSTDSNDEKQVEKYRALILDAFHDYNGNIICGGTLAGISKLVGEVQRKYPTKVHTIGYVPKKLPFGTDLDKRYSEHRTTDDIQFTPMQPIKYWADILYAGIDPTSVKVLGLGGASLSAFEYRLAMTLGATVAILDEQKLSRKLKNDDYLAAALMKMVALPIDHYTLRAYVGTGIPGLPPEIRNEIAKSLHKTYVSNFAPFLPQSNESMYDWDELDEKFRESNRRAVDHVSQKLSEIGYELEYKEEGNVVPIEFSKEEVEILAEMEHGRWIVDRMIDGWKYGPEKDYSKMTNPYLVRWEGLDESIRQIDRELVRAMPEFLGEFKIQIVKK
ncbi:MAG: RyR domain-containing protein [bacterium]|nr:RyR domain-containing protein [bacterium]